MSELIAGIHEGLHEAQIFAETLERLARITGARFATFAVPDENFQEFSQTRMFGDFSPSHGLALEGYAAENPGSNPVLRYARTCPDAHWFDTHRSLPRNQREHDGFLNFTASVIGTPRWCATFMPSRQGVGMGLALNYASADDVTDEKCRLQQLLFRHIKLARSLAIQSSLLDASIDPMFLLDGFGRVVHQNRAADLFLHESRSLLRLCRSRLLLPEPHLQDRLNHIIQEAVVMSDTAWPGGVLPVRSSPVSLWFLMRILPVPAMARALGPVTVRALVRMVPIGAPQAMPTEPLLRDGLGLTAAEARFATAFMTNGGDIREAAGDLEISYATARVHLYRIFDKANVRSQAQLLQLLTQLANMP